MKCCANLRLTYCAVSALLICILPHGAKTVAEEAPRPANSASHIKTLSSETLEGRLSGSAGGFKAGEYIAGEFKRIGLFPAIGDSYFQLFEISLKSLGKDNRLVISGRELKILEDYVPLTVCPPGEVMGKKVAVVRYDEAVPDRWFPAKIKEAEEAGAKALVILKQDLYSDYTVWKELVPPKLRARWEKSLKEDFAHFLQMKVTQKMNLTPPVTSKIPCLLVREDSLTKNRENPPPLTGGGEWEGEQRVLAPLPLVPSHEGRGNRDQGFSSEPLMSQGLTKGHENTACHPEPKAKGLMRQVNQILRCAQNDSKVAGAFSDEIIMKVDIVEEKLSARNIIGYLPGKGDHKDETVIVGAHYDHLGLDSKGRYFPGADDNASGVAALLEVAERLAQKGTERSVVFIAFDGEEWGLTGSGYYTDYPVFPLDKTVLMINMDTIGRNEPDAIHFLGSQRNHDVRRVAGEIAERTGMKLLDDIEFAFKYGSDHYSFYEKGIPAIDLTSSYHEDFHRITDTPERVNVDKVAKIADLVHGLTLEVSNSEVNFQKPLQVDVPFPEQR